MQAGVLDDALVLELTGEDQVENVCELMARSGGLSRIDEDTMLRLSKLTLLTLSTNSLRDVSPLRHCAALVHLNLSHNSIEDIAALSSLTLLEKLFLSNNRIQTIAPLASCTRLTTLSLFRNSLGDLDRSVAVLQRLPGLTELDMAENPCSFSTAYRHTMIAELALSVLDGDEVTAEAHAKAEDFLAAFAPRARPVDDDVATGAEDGAGDVDVTGDLFERTLSAPVPPSSSRGPGSAPLVASSSAAAAAVSRPPRPRTAGSSSSSSRPSSASSQPASSANKPSSFVAKLRTDAVSHRSSSSSSSSAPDQAGKSGAAATSGAVLDPLAGLPGASAGPDPVISMATVMAEFDPKQPLATVSRLLEVIAGLQLELSRRADAATMGGHVGSSKDDIIVDIIGENRTLRAKLGDLEEMTGQVDNLIKENKRLKQYIRELKAQHTAQITSMAAQLAAQGGGGGGGGGEAPWGARPTTPGDVTRIMTSTGEAEILALLERNKQSLAQLRRELEEVDETTG
jgi:hypothetical protein